MKVFGIGKEFSNRINSVCISIVCVVISQDTMQLHIILINLVDETRPDLRKSIKIYKLSTIKEISKMQNCSDVVFFTVWKKLFFKKLE